MGTNDPVNGDGGRGREPWDDAEGGDEVWDDDADTGDAWDDAQRGDDAWRDADERAGWRDAGDPGAGGRRSPWGEAGRTSDAWEDVAAHFSELGQRVRDRFERPSHEPRPTAEGRGESMRRAMDALDDAFTSIGDAMRDPAFRREAESSIASLGEALGASLQQVGEQLQRRFGQQQPGTQPTGPPDARSTDTPTPSVEPAPGDATRRAPRPGDGPPAGAPTEPTGQEATDDTDGRPPPDDPTI